MFMSRMNLPCSRAQSDRAPVFRRQEAQKCTQHRNLLSLPRMNLARAKWEMGIKPDRQHGRMGLVQKRARGASLPETPALVHCRI